MVESSQQLLWRCSPTPKQSAKSAKISLHSIGSPLGFDAALLKYPSDVSATIIDIDGECQGASPHCGGGSIGDLGPRLCGRNFGEYKIQSIWSYTPNGNSKSVAIYGTILPPMTTLKQR